MAKLIEDGKKVKYDNYDEYVKIQDSRYHNFDCPKCFKQNIELINILRDKNINFKNILDIGCRDASYFDKMNQEGIKCMGLDISERSVEYAKSKGRDVILGDAANLKSYFNFKFDLIMSCHSFEHLLKPEIVCDQCFEILNDGGHMIIRMPNEGDKIRNTVTLAHTRAYTKYDILTILKNTKFNILNFNLNDSNEFIIIVKK